MAEWNPIEHLHRVASMKYGRHLNWTTLVILVFDGLMVFAYLVYRWLGNDDRGHPTFSLVYNILHAAWFQPSLISVLVVTAILVFLVLGFVITPAQTVLKSKQKENHDVPDVRIRALLGWIGGLADGDNTDVASRIPATIKEPIPHFEANPPYLLFPVDVMNGSIFLVEIGKKITGHIIAEQRTLVGNIELSSMSGNDGSLMHGLRRDLVFKQYLHQDDIQYFVEWKKQRAASGANIKTVRFGLDNLHLWIITKPPDGTGYRATEGVLRMLPPQVSLNIASLPD